MILLRMGPLADKDVDGVLRDFVGAADNGCVGLEGTLGRLKIYNILDTETFDEHLPIPDTLKNIRGLGYLRRGSMNKLMACELRGTIDALQESGRPVIRITLPRVNAYSVAQLLYMLEVETAMSGRLYRINAFDQPGVEAGKRIARELMGEGG